jgi:hypothetical protein
MTLSKDEQSILEKNWPFIQNDLHDRYPGATTKQLGNKPDIGGLSKLTGLDEEQVESMLRTFADGYRNSDPDTYATNPDRLQEQGAARVGDPENRGTDVSGATRGGSRSSSKS